MRLRGPHALAGVRRDGYFPDGLPGREALQHGAERGKAEDSSVCDNMPNRASGCVAAVKDSRHWLEALKIICAEGLMPTYVRGYAKSSAGSRKHFQNYETRIPSSVDPSRAGHRGDLDLGERG